MDHNNQNEAKTNGKQPMIGFFLLDAYFCYYRIISVDAKKKSADSQEPAMPTVIR